jgi:hypothetical protein
MMLTDIVSVDLDRSVHGARLAVGAVSDSVQDLLKIVASLPVERAGIRIGDLDGLTPFLAPDGPIGSVAAGELGPGSRPVRAILFDKTADTNWSLAWHQDRTICVRHRIETPGFGPWTRKDGRHHVAPPVALLSRMITVRVHLDPVPADNAPLLIAPGSHRHGRVPVAAIEPLVQTCGIHACLAEAGDVWVYATPILHASEAARRPARRRVLQVDYAADELPGALEWLGVGRSDDVLETVPIDRRTFPRAQFPCG